MVDDTGEETPIQDLVFSLAASPNFAQDGICFAARTSGLYRSDDGGITWRSTYDSLALEAPLATTAVVVSPNFGSDRSVFAGAQGGVLRSVVLRRTGREAPINTVGESHMNMFARFVKDESGATAIEYGLIAALIAVAIIGAATMVGDELVNTFTKVSDELKAANTKS